MKAVAFFYAWNDRRELDAYFGQVADAFAQAGVALTIVLGNELLHPRGGQQTRHPFVDEARLIRFVQDEAPDFIFSINNAGLSERLKAATTAPILIWLVDDLPHLFLADGPPRSGLPFAGRERIVCYTTTLARQIADAFPHARDRIGWVSHGTNLAGRTPDRLPAAYPISFVGSCLQSWPFQDLLAAARQRGAVPEILAALHAMRADYAAATHDRQASPELDAALAAADMTWLDYRRTLSDVLTNQNRVAGLSRIADLGLTLFGNDPWLQTANSTPALVEAFAFDVRIDSYDKLLDVYARSKISVNIPNVQNAAGLAARVFDILASPSLLITEAHPDSDLFRLFGADCPIPTYRDFDHLRELCAYYLEHEEERAALVARCNRLVDERFLLGNRVAEMLAFAGIEVPVTAAPGAKPAIVPADAFHGLPRGGSWKPWLRLKTQRALRGALRPALERIRRSGLMR